jgi:hypothetical protein
LPTGYSVLGSSHVGPGQDPAEIRLGQVVFAWEGGERAGSHRAIYIRLRECPNSRVNQFTLGEGLARGSARGGDQQEEPVQLRVEDHET